VLEQIQKDNPTKVRVVYRHFPLPGHPLALIATQAAEAAGLQGKFWEMHDRIFEKQADWAQKSAADMETWLKDQAREFGLDMAKFESDLKSDALVNKAREAQSNGRKIGIPGTPFLLINGKPYSGPRDADNLGGIIKLIDLAPRQFTVCPPMTVDTAKKYVATLKTEKGDIVLELYPDKAPMTVNSFVFLAKNGWFDGVTFHRVIEDFVAQTGDPTGTGFGGPGYAFDNEISPDLTFDKPGMVGMANSGPGSNGSQFFITFSALPMLDGKYTVFGKVLSGLEIAQKLTPRDTSTGAVLPPGDKIIGVTIEEK
jgi:cyclophilin family peptidyl-prolyl cis-trans isomerase